MKGGPQTIQKFRLNEVYGIPDYKIPELKITIITGEKIIQGKAYDLPLNPVNKKLLPALHKFKDVNWLQEQHQILDEVSLEKYQYSNFRIPTCPSTTFNNVRQLLKRDLQKSNIPEHLKISDEDLEKIGEDDDEDTESYSILSDIIDNNLKQIPKSKIRKEGIQVIQGLIQQLRLASAEINYCAVPPAAGINWILNEKIAEWIANYENRLCINRATIIVQKIISLIKYTKYDEEFFGITYEEASIAAKTSREILKEMKNCIDPTERLTVHFQNLVDGGLIIMPSDEVIYQRKVAEPSIPSSAIRVEPSKLGAG